MGYKRLFLLSMVALQYTFVSSYCCLWSSSRDPLEPDQRATAPVQRDHTLVLILNDNNQARQPVSVQANVPSTKANIPPDLANNRSPVIFLTPYVGQMVCLQGRLAVIYRPYNGDAQNIPRQTSRVAKAATIPVQQGDRPAILQVSTKRQGVGNSGPTYYNYSQPQDMNIQSPLYIQTEPQRKKRRNSGVQNEATVAQNVSGPLSMNQQNSQASTTDQKQPQRPSHLSASSTNVVNRPAEDPRSIALQKSPEANKEQDLVATILEEIRELKNSKAGSFPVREVNVLKIINVIEGIKTEVFTVDDIDHNCDFASKSSIYQVCEFLRERRYLRWGKVRKFVHWRGEKIDALIKAMPLSEVVKDILIRKGTSKRKNLHQQPNRADHRPPKKRRNSAQDKATVAQNVPEANKEEDVVARLLSEILQYKAEDPNALCVSVETIKSIIKQVKIIGTSTFTVGDVASVCKKFIGKYPVYRTCSFLNAIRCLENCDSLKENKRTKEIIYCVTEKLEEIMKCLDSESWTSIDGIVIREATNKRENPHQPDQRPTKRSRKVAQG